MALTLASFNAMSTAAVQKGVVQTITEESSLFGLMPFVNANGNAYKYRADGSIGGAEFRARNGGYTPATGSFVERTVNFAILGREADVDKADVKMQGGDVPSLRAEVTRQAALAVRREFQNAVINGDSAGSSNEFDGLAKLIPAGKQVDAAGLEINGATSDDRQDFLDKLDELLGSVNSPNAIFLGAKALSALKSVQRRENGANEGVEMFGVTVPSYAGIPLIDLGNDANGAPIIGSDETDGTDIYAVNLGAEGTFGVTVGGVDVQDMGEIDDKPAYRTRIEFICGLAMIDGSAAVLKGALA